jgi:hypothetical protein
MRSQSNSCSKSVTVFSAGPRPIVLKKSTSFIILQQKNYLGHKIGSVPRCLLTQQWFPIFKKKVKATVADKSSLNKPSKATLLLEKCATFKIVTIHKPKPLCLKRNKRSHNTPIKAQGGEEV